MSGLRLVVAGAIVVAVPVLVLWGAMALLKRASED